MKKILSFLILLSLGSNILSQPRFMQSRIGEEMSMGEGEESVSAIQELIDLKKTLMKIKLTWAALMMKMKAEKARLMMNHKKQSFELKIRNLMDLQEGQSIEEASKVWKDRLLDLANSQFNDWEEFGKMFMNEKKQLTQMTKQELAKFEPEGYQPKTKLGKVIKGKLEEIKTHMPEMTEVKPMAKQMATESLPMAETEVK